MRIAYTAGDPAGIGYEIFNKTKSQGLDLKLGLELLLIDDLDELAKFAKQKPGPSAAAGEHAYKTLRQAHKMALNNEVAAIITGPVAKGSLNMAGYKFSGQTEVLAELNGLSSSDIEMIFIYKEFRTLLATRHIAISEVPFKFLQRAPSAIKHAITAMQDLFSIKNPRVGLAGLNPHAGEGGLFGEEENQLSCTLEDLRNEYPHAQISDFMSADSFLAKAAQNIFKGTKPDYDIYVAAYHDQALPLIKGISGFGAVNLSYGLPYIRVSMDHGTGFDIAGRNIASEDGLIACMELLSGLVKREKPAQIG